MSDVGACEANPEKCFKINAPEYLIDLLLGITAYNALFLVFSSDHVYEGAVDEQPPSFRSTKDSLQQSANGYSETSALYPINVYGQSKKKLERIVRMKCRYHVILRSSVIYGPLLADFFDVNEAITTDTSNLCDKKTESLSKVHSTFLQFLLKELRVHASDLSNQSIGTNQDNLVSNKKVTLFQNEIRNFVCIFDVLKCCKFFVDQFFFQGQLFHEIFNMGGSESCSRVVMAHALCDVFSSDGSYKMDKKKILGMKRSECQESWAKKTPSPSNLKMDCGRLYEKMRYTFLSLSQGLELCKYYMQDQLSSI
ncbi:hypothetical protein RFI_03048 [Reticulomyxa filosa]|uniref:RmlD-like substrate binding domain-containing protein n=1 Tax=Reticulomyxa filosa TaxID=46433 RepID=X6P8R9_RETFI|nr:hypothetical protein RFI_03048 [Reticulomyxa filosa]|eukprot:ETO34047.1 hypothetical protein RFI_03048 [Reticulomyxa filosa]